MPIQISAEDATEVFLKAIALAERGLCSARWEDSLRRLSQLCETGPKTHIAFVGTALLAKATNQQVDVFALKTKAGTPGAYSARNLAMNVLVPLSRAHRIHLGVTGREPLNNQPYFQNDAVSRGMRVRGDAASAVNAVCDLLDELGSLDDRDELLAALAAFVKVRGEYWRPPRSYVAPETVIEFDALIHRITQFVEDDSEGGRRAQAVAAGLMDVLEDSVETARVNDPDRRFPGDVAVRASDGELTRVLEVRDKPVNASDLAAFAEKVARAGVSRAGVLAVSLQQQPLEVEAAQGAAAENGVNLQVFVGWRSYVRQLLFWMPADIAYPVDEAHRRVYERLVQLECSAAAQDLWLQQRE